MIANQAKRLMVAAFVLALVFEMIGAGLAWADRDVYLANVGGQVAIGSANDSSPAEPDLDTRVFARVLVLGSGFPPYFPDYGLDEPGFFALPAGNAEIPFGASALPGNKDVMVSLLPFTVNGNTASLFFWDGSGSVNFHPISQPGVAMAIDNLIGSTGPAGGADIHPVFRLDNGGAGVPADGVYLTSPTVGVTSLADSERFFILYLADALVTNGFDAEDLSNGLDNGETIFKEKDFGFFLVAQDYVQNNLIPEPSCLSLAFVTIAALGGSVRRRPRA